MLSFLGGVSPQYEEQDGRSRKAVQRADIQRKKAEEKAPLYRKLPSCLLQLSFGIFGDNFRHFRWETFVQNLIRYRIRDDVRTQVSDPDADALDEELMRKTAKVCLHFPDGLCPVPSFRVPDKGHRPRFIPGDGRLCIVPEAGILRWI